MNISFPTHLLKTLVTVGAVALLDFSASRSRAQPAPESAPVPSAVAIARPSASEVEQARQSLKRYLETADSATKTILSKYPDLIAVQPPRPNSATVPSLAPGFRTKHHAN